MKAFFIFDFVILAFAREKEKNLLPPSKHKKRLENEKQVERHDGNKHQYANYR